MRILMAAIGTRGDIQPMLAVALGLRTAGHGVTLVAGSNFETWITDHGFDFAPSIDMLQAMNSEEGRAWIEGRNPLVQLRAMLDRLGEAMVEPLIRLAPDHDALLTGFTTEPFGQTVSERFGIPQMTLALQPYPPTRSSAASLVTPIPGVDSPLNQLAGHFAERVIWWTGAAAVNRIRATLGLPAHTAASYRHRVRNMARLFGISPQVMPQPADWDAQNAIVGYWFFDEGADYVPPPALARFLDAGAPPVYIGFGSMTTSDAARQIDLIVEALRMSGQRGIIGAGWSGAQAEQLPESIYLLDKAPHDWLFPRMAAVVHHGGAGTTAAGVRAGIPSLIVPHFADQPYWARRMRDLGVSPAPIPKKVLTATRLAAGITQAVTDSGMRGRVAALSTAIRAETGVENAIARIEQKFVMPSLQGSNRQRG